MDDLDESIEVVKLIQEVIFRMNRTIFKGFEDSGITLPQGMIIRNLNKCGRMKVSDLSYKLNLSNSTISGMLDRLEKLEIIIRTRSQDDKRVVYVSLLPKFAEMHKNFHKKADENIQSIMSKGTPEDVEKIVEGLNILKKLLSESLGDTPKKKGVSHV
jgi:MarR family transcriptional regulator, organic hydroperoxide resistance regulator